MSIATAAPRAARRKEHSRLLIAVLVISLVLNLCFIAATVWFRLHAPPAGRNLAERYQEIASQLDLDAQQRAAFDRYIAAMRSRADQMRQETDPLMSAAWEELAKPQPDAAKVERLFDEAGERRRATQHEATSQTVALLNALSPEQRARFVGIMRDWRASWRQRSGNRTP